MNEDHMKLRKLTAAFAGALILLSGCSAAEAGDDVLVIGMPPGEDSPEMLQFQETVTEIFEEATGKEVEVQTAADYLGVIEALRGGHIDAALMSPFATVIGMETAPLELLLAGPGGDDPASVIATPATSGITGLEQLEGKTVTLVDPASTTGNLMPRLTLAAAGLEMDADYDVAFAGGHDAVATALAGGHIDAGAMNHTMYHQMIENGVIDPEQVVVLAETDPIPMGSTIIVREDLEQELKDLIRDELPGAWPADEETVRVLGAAPAPPTEADIEAATNLVTSLGIDLEDIR
jgi:phosphonate transport system substrate-binding protein